MSTDTKQLRVFRQEFLDYIEGLRETPPSLETLTPLNRLAASRWIKLIDAARGVDPYASRPSTADLVARSQVVQQGRDERSIAGELEAGLRRRTDAEASVVSDAASDAAGLASRLVVHTRGLRLRVLIEADLSDLDALLGLRIAEMLAVFGAFPDTTALIMTTPGPGPKATVVDRYDVVSAFETPSGAYAPPRARRPIADLVVSCAQFISEIMPAFRPFEYAAFAVPDSTVRSLDVERVARAAVASVIETGRRARLPAKRLAWSELVEAETAGISALLRRGLQRPIAEAEYLRRVDAIVEAA